MSEPFLPTTVRPPRPGEVVLRDDAGDRWLRFEAPRETVVAAGLADVIPALERVERGVAAGAWAAGFVSYEAAPAFDPALSVRPDGGGFPLLWFGLYAPPEVVAPPEAPPVQQVVIPEWEASVDEPAFREAIARIKTHIRTGDTYQVNYTYRLRTGDVGDPRALFARLAASRQAPYAAWVDTGDWVLASASPELFFRVDGDVIASKPMKGTSARGLTTEDDRARAAGLRASEKERAENVMIVDMVRNDLGRIALAGSVSVPRLFDVERYPTVLQMTSTVTAWTQAGLVELFCALFPPASITGAPKVETMRLIAGLETAPRRVYTGTIGFIGPGRTMQFNVAIRTVLIDRRSGGAEYGVGSGIVWDADPGREWAECHTKTRVLTRRPEEFELLETLRWTPAEGYALLERHLGRLADSAEYFAFRLDPGAVGAVRAALQRAASAFGGEPRRVRLTVGRGGQVLVESTPLPAPPAGRPRVAVARQPVDSTDLFLYHKTTRRRVYEAARAAFPGVTDVILVNARGEVTESTIATVAVELGGRLCTPPVACGLLPGTLRAELLSRGELREQVITTDDLRHSRRVVLLNSVRGRWDVEVEGGDGQ